MTTEFTGERVVPGQVDADLWNEHLARYLFAARLARNKRVLDLACGCGYGCACLAETARAVTGVDIAPEAVEYARARYGAANVAFEVAPVTEVPLPDASFDLITAFEVIEHVEDWRRMLAEARRLLAPGGQFVVSTPNRDYYAESRKAAGPNPFHAREFSFGEFQEALAAFFPHVSMFVQNHAPAVLFQPLKPASGADVRLESGAPDAEASHFFLAVCALAPQTGSPAFLYLPTAANVLRERERHIARLEQELAQKDEWLAKQQQEHQDLLVLHRRQGEELVARNQWAEKLNTELREAGERVVALQEELAAEQAAGRETAAAYQAKVDELERECASRAQWARDAESRLAAEIEVRDNELRKCVDLLHQTEAVVEERTRWALELERGKRESEARLSSVLASRWYQLGRRIGLGPRL